MLITIVGLVVGWNMIGWSMVNNAMMDSMMNSRSSMVDWMATKSCERYGWSTSHKRNKSN